MLLIALNRPVEVIYPYLILLNYLREDNIVINIIIICPWEITETLSNSEYPFLHETNCLRLIYEGGSIYNGNPFITPSTNALGFYAICQAKDQSVAVIMVHETLLDLTKFNKLQTF